MRERRTGNANEDDKKWSGAALRSRQAEEDKEQQERSYCADYEVQKDSAH